MRKKVKFNHSAELVIEALNISEEEAREVHLYVDYLTQNTRTISEAIEHLWNDEKLSDNLLIYALLIIGKRMVMNEAIHRIVRTIGFL